MDFKKFFFSLILFIIAISSVAYSNSIKEVNTNNLLSMIANSKGQVVLVNFWASWCPYCQRELQELKALREKYTTSELKIIGVSFDSSKSSFTKMLEKSKINYPNFLSSDDSMGMFFGVMGVPTTIIYDKNGKIVKQFSGYTHMDEIEEIIVEILKER